jgi:hypothetical protein
LNILNGRHLFEDYSVFLIWVLWVRLRIMDINERRWDKGSGHIIHSIDQPHGAILSLDAGDKVKENVEAPEGQVFISIAHLIFAPHRPGRWHYLLLLLWISDALDV